MQDQQRKLKEFVYREVHVNQSALVEALLAKEILAWDDLENLYVTCKERGDDLCPGCREDEDCEEEMPQDIFEWWVVSNWLAERLGKESDPILDTEYGIWWGRTTTGQVIWMDSVIVKIFEDIA